MDETKIAIRVTDVSALEQLDAFVHDQPFVLSGIVFKADVVTIPVRRYSGPSRLIQRRWLSSRFELDLIQSWVYVRKVHTWRVENDEGIDSYSISNWSYEKGLLRLISCENTVLIFDVSSIDVELVDTEAICGKAKFTRWPFGIESWRYELDDLT